MSSTPGVCSARRIAVASSWPCGEERVNECVFRDSANLFTGSQSSQIRWTLMAAARVEIYDEKRLDPAFASRDGSGSKTTDWNVKAAPITEIDFGIIFRSRGLGNSLSYYDLPSSMTSMG